ncbi:histone-like nucleoid-structuring protein Lsr2 [Geodermatophilus maliterrae]|uniref:Lsr2 family protein n=1 Tax=Geodermatophilus maliterrae TaxID=3162531 RepID=A0ABV3XD39_9ACTN
MATKTIILMHDDLTDAPADTTVSFGLDGVDYEIDLTAANAEELREVLERFVAAGRTVGGVRRRRRPTSPAAEVDPKAVRAWAAAKGYEVSNRGRIPASVVEAFKAAGN